MLCHRALEAVTPLVADCSVVTASDSAAIKEYCQLLLMRYWGVGVGRGGEEWGRGREVWGRDKEEGGRGRSGGADCNGC